MTLTYENCEPFLPLGEGDRATVVKVYDGDSLTLGWTDSSHKNVRVSCRIRGIDTPELRGSSEREKELAVRARERLHSKVGGRVVTIRLPGKEKYGRVLADLETDDGVSIADYMLQDREVCRPYRGGRKAGWDSVK